MLVSVAKILSTHGIKGELKVSPLILNPEILFYIKKLYLSKNKDQSLEIESLRKGPGFNTFLIKFKNIDFKKAQTLINKFLYIDLKELPPLKDDEFYYYQIIGFKVKDKSGNIWGEVKEVMPVGEYDLLLIKSKNCEDFYIPLIEEYVEEVDFSSKTILVKDIKSLVESQKI